MTGPDANHRVSRAEPVHQRKFVEAPQLAEIGERLHADGLCRARVVWAVLCSAKTGFTDLSAYRNQNWCTLWHDRTMFTASGVLIRLIGEALRWCRLAFRLTQSVKAENLFLRRQLALYVERGIKPRRIDPVTRISLALLSRFFNWRDALVVVRPETLIRWHRTGWRLSGV